MSSSFLSGCGITGFGGAPGTAQVRFVEVSPGAPPLDLYVNGAAAAFGVGYESYTSYLPVAPGAATLSAHRGGSAQPLATVQRELEAGHNYTAVLSHGLGSLHEQIFADRQAPAPAGQMAVRVLHAAEGAGTLTVLFTPAGAATLTPPIASLTVAAGSASGYVHLPATGSYTVVATEGANGVSLPVSEKVAIRALSGAVQTVVFAGTASPGAHSLVSFTMADVDPQ